MSNEIILTTTPEIPGHKIKKVLGIVHGMSIRTRGFGGRLIAGLEALAGGRGEAYLTELRKAKDEALGDLVRHAQSIGANAVIGIDFETSEILEGFILVSVTGTAVVIEPE